jgi:hypothetical protein
MKTEVRNLKLKEFKRLFRLFLAMTVGVPLLLISLFSDPSQSKGSYFAFGTFFGVCLAFSIVTGLMVLILSDENKSNNSGSGMGGGTGTGEANPL